MMKLVYLISALSLCYPVYSERDTDCSSKLTPEAQLKCKFARKKRTSSLADRTSLALADRTSLASQINNDISLQVERMRDVDGVTKFQSTAIETINAAIMLFTKKNFTVHEITQGISTIAEGLWVCIDLFIPEPTKEHQVYQWFKRAWLATFTTLRSLDAAEIEGRVEAFNENGQGHEIAHVVYLCVDASLDLIDKFVNGTVAEKIMPWFVGVRAITKGTAKSWEAIANGEPDKAATAIYEAIREASEPLLPDSLKNNEIYKSITKVLDKQIGNLNKYVMAFKKDLAEVSICIRNTWSRPSKVAKKCPPGRQLWLQCCDMESHGMFIQQWEAGARDELLQFTRNTCGIKPDCNNNDECPMNFETQRCLAECPTGFREQKSKEFCWQDCPEDFPIQADNGQKCAKNSNALDMLNAERVAKGTAIAGGVFGFVNNIVNKNFEGVADSLNGVIESSVEFAATFTFARCKLPEVLPTVQC